MADEKKRGRKPVDASAEPEDRRSLSELVILLKNEDFKHRNGRPWTDSTLLAERMRRHVYGVDAEAMKKRAHAKVLDTYFKFIVSHVPREIIEANFEEERAPPRDTVKKVWCTAFGAHLITY